MKNSEIVSPFCCSSMYAHMYIIGWKRFLNKILFYRKNTETFNEVKMKFISFLTKLKKVPYQPGRAHSFHAMPFLRKITFCCFISFFNILNSRCKKWNKIMNDSYEDPLPFWNDFYTFILLCIAKHCTVLICISPVCILKICAVHVPTIPCILWVLCYISYLCFSFYQTF